MLLRKGLSYSFGLCSLVCLALCQGLAAKVEESEVESPQGHLVCVISGIDEMGGVLRLTLDSDASEYESKKPPLRTIEMRVTDPVHSFTFDNLPRGRYAIKAHLDSNADGRINLNLLGIPKEKYGLSQNVRGKFGLPPFEEAAFEIGKLSVRQDIELKYHSLY